ncbi:OmpA family protein [Parashewanella curva]|uniref:OmpA family protein n=1 Tax=Parashewanella curva TaxID=2338552 RepID=A0A3L8PVY7_9GAMM|nr:OmpA family protein [Parashewanella curva]RLV58222.1 OmpA family protein [Parashewanella curva]
MWRKLTIAGLLLVPLTSMAQLRHFVANLDESQWRVTQNSPIECRLEHQIPLYGNAVFSSYASKKINLDFELAMWQKPEKVTKARLVSRAPQWRPGRPDIAITEITYQRYFNGEVPKPAAWSMLNELAKGMQPTFYYTDWFRAEQQVAVGLSAANFRRMYNQFRQCLSNLLPYSFDDIAFTVLNFKSGGKELTAYSLKQMQRVQEYLSYDPEVELVLVDAYTDSYGSRNVNKRVSNERANQIKKYLMEHGIQQNRILTTGHGETKHLVANDTIRGRQQNRRVVIQISKGA